jgi:hypothetical protein
LCVKNSQCSGKGWILAASSQVAPQTHVTDGGQCAEAPGTISAAITWGLHDCADQVAAGTAPKFEINAGSCLSPGVKICDFQVFYGCNDCQGVCPE